MSVWAGLARARGLGAKKLAVRTLTYGGGPTDNISSNIYTDPLLLVTIPDFEKVDFAVVDILSSAALGSGFAASHVTSYSNRTFSLKLEGYVSGLAPLLTGGQGVSGLNISGVLLLRAMIVGEGRKETD